METVIPAAPAAPPVILSLALEQLIPSPTNPRKYFDEGRLAELAASMQTHGILQPLVVRPAKPSPALKGGAFYEIVAGERRFRAARKAKLATVPAVLRDLTDVQVLEAQLIENGQRDDIHPIESADTFAALQRLDGSYNTKVIASKIGKSERYVQNVLHYAVLVPKAKQAFLDNHINAGHADLIARLQPADQERALKACFDNLYGEDKERGSISVRQLGQWIRNSIRVDPIADAPQLPEFQKLVDEKKGDAAAAAATVLQVSGSYMQTPATKGLLSPRDYHVVEKKQTCGHMRRALIIIGDDRGKLVDICTARTECKVHWKYEVEQLTRAAKKPAAKAGGATKANAAAQKRERAARVRAQQKQFELEELRKRKLKVWDHMLAKVAPKVIPNKPTPALLALFGVWEKRPPTWRDIAIEELHNIGAYRLTTNDAPRIVKILRPLGIDLLAIERQLFPPAPAKGLTKTTGPLRSTIRPPKKRKAGKKR